MVGTKRKSTGGTDAASKRARSSLSSPVKLVLTEDELNDMSKDELVQHALELQAQLEATVAATTPKEMSAEELAEKSTKARHMLVKGIEKQMKVRVNE